MSTNNNAALPSDSAADGKFDDLISLVMRRSRGEVGNDDIEDAINSIIGAPAAASTRAVKNNDTIIPDEGNYDDDDESDCAEPPQKKHAASELLKEHLPSAKEAKKASAARNKKLDEIPFGKMAERMLVTFGDGTQPHLDVISSALLGTRSCLQRAILDARALHRKNKEQWHQARAAAVMHKSSSMKDQIKKTTVGELTATVASIGDSELSFRALSGIDPLRFDTPCGFGIEQLNTLFPEELSAYQRWKKMHKAYTDNSADDIKQTKELDDEDDTNNKNKEGTEEDGDDCTNDYSGRLTMRLANFDARTTEMGDDSYLKFADYRRGSFLPKNTGAPTADLKEWKENKQQKKRGRPKQRTNWQNLHHSCVVFLHWVGFDQRSALSPPNEETTQALGFLAYDFFGKIVEKAVSLRLESTSSKGKARTLFGSEEPILELTGGDQLEIDDIKRSLAEVKMNSLYSSTDVDLGNSSKIAQLYFGPGFEDRLELELDEIFGPKKKKLSAIELERRKDEETLFSGIAAPPTLLNNINDVLKNNDEELKDEEE